MLSRQTEIWNRAALNNGGSNPRKGDIALASLLLAHGLVMNGGVFHALECMSTSERENAINGFNYFGLQKAATVLSQPAEDTEEFEETSNSAYWQAVPSDSAIDHAFKIQLLASPNDFAPATQNEHS